MLDKSKSLTIHKVWRRYLRNKRKNGHNTQSLMNFNKFEACDHFVSLPLQIRKKLLTTLFLNTKFFTQTSIWCTVKPQTGFGHKPTLRKTMQGDFYNFWRVKNAKWKLRVHTAWPNSKERSRKIITIGQGFFERNLMKGLSVGLNLKLIF